MLLIGIFVINFCTVDLDQYPCDICTKSPEEAVDIYRKRTVETSSYRPELVVDRHSPTLVRDLFKKLKRDELNLTKEPDITFLGEDGIDANGLTKELCHMIVQGLRDGSKGYVLFEGQPDHLLPIHCEEHIQSNLFVYTGQIIAFAFLHGNIGFLGLSRAITHYLVTGNINCAIEYLCKNDLPDITVRMAVGEVSNYDSE